MGKIHRVIPADKQGLIYWFHGNSGSGKTHMAINFKMKNKIILDADDLREVWLDLSFTQRDRNIQNRRLARLARVLSIQGYNVCVASICPYANIRKEINQIIPTVRWVYVNSPESKRPSKKYPFEEGGWSKR